MLGNSCSRLYDEDWFIFKKWILDNNNEEFNQSMLTATINPQRVMNVIWSLNDGVRTDLNDFIRSTSFPEKTKPSLCLYTLEGEKNVALLEWRSLLQSVTSLLEQGISIKFICTNKKIYDWIQYFGFSLLGEVIFSSSK